MRGQTELIVFILLFIISIFLFVSATIWSRGIFQENIDVARIQATEKFMKDLNDMIKILIKYGGSQDISYNLDGTINLAAENMIEVKTTIEKLTPFDWTNITSDGSFIREKLEGTTLTIQLIYPPGDYEVEFLPGNSTLAKPTSIKLEKIPATGIIRIKITFV
jgi:hypothetical protein